MYLDIPDRAAFFYYQPLPSAPVWDYYLKALINNSLDIEMGTTRHIEDNRQKVATRWEWLPWC
jgi:hypothetical protein